jgi:hypothetical protein
VRDFLKTLLKKSYFNSRFSELSDRLLQPIGNINNILILERVIFWNIMENTIPSGLYRHKKVLKIVLTLTSCFLPISLPESSKSIRAHT